MKIPLYLLFTFFVLNYTSPAVKIFNHNKKEVSTSIYRKHEIKTTKLKINIGKTSFMATLNENDAAHAFKSLLPLTLHMTDLNYNEKYGLLSSDLPTNAVHTGTIHEGDLMHWQSNTLVLFYKTFTSPYSYTKLGQIENPAGIASALGSGMATVSFEME